VLLFNKENTKIPQNPSRNSSSSSTTAAVVSVSENNKLPKLLYETCLGGQREKKIPTTLNRCYCRIKQKKTTTTTTTTTKQNLQPQLHTKNHPTSQTIHPQNKKVHPQFTNKVTNFSPNLLASLNFLQDTT
jgi:hypothetical protein